MHITPELLADLDAPIRPLKRTEYERLTSLGYFGDEQIELLFGVMVPKARMEPPHAESANRVQERLCRGLGERAKVRGPSQFAASETSAPEPDVLVVPDEDYWSAHPARAFLIVEIARPATLDKNKALKAVLYALANVDEYWIVNHVEGVVEVYRDRHDGEWRQRTTHGRGDTIKMLAFPDVEIAVSDILPPVAP